MERSALGRRPGRGGHPAGPVAARQRADSAADRLVGGRRLDHRRADSSSATPDRTGSSPRWPSSGRWPWWRSSPLQCCSTTSSTSASWSIGSLVYGALTGLVTVLFVAVYSPAWPVLPPNSATSGSAGSPAWPRPRGRAAGRAGPPPARSPLEARFLGARHEPLRALARLQDRVVDGAADDAEVLEAVAETVATRGALPVGGAWQSIVVRRWKRCGDARGRRRMSLVAAPCSTGVNGWASCGLPIGRPASASVAPTSHCSISWPTRPPPLVYGLRRDLDWRRFGRSHWRRWRTCRPAWAGTCTTASRRCWPAPACRRRHCAGECPTGPRRARSRAARLPAAQRCQPDPTPRPRPATRCVRRRHASRRICAGSSPRLKGPTVPEVHLEVLPRNRSPSAVRQGALSGDLGGGEQCRAPCPRSTRRGDGQRRRRLRSSRGP